MISKKMENMVANSSAIRAMFVEGKQMAEKYGKEKVIVTILPDRAERYFSTGLL